MLRRERSSLVQKPATFLLDDVAQTFKDVDSTAKQVGDLGDWVLPGNTGSSRVQQRRRKEYDSKMSMRRQSTLQSISSSDALHSRTSQLTEMLDLCGDDSIEQASTEVSEVVTSIPNWIKLRPEIIALSQRSKALAQLRVAQHSTQTAAHVQTSFDEKSASTSPPLSSDSMAPSGILSVAVEQALNLSSTQAQLALDERLRANVSAPAQASESAETSAPAQQASSPPDFRSASDELGGESHTSAEWEGHPSRAERSAEGPTDARAWHSYILDLHGHALTHDIGQRACCW